MLDKILKVKFNSSNLITSLSFLLTFIIRFQYNLPVIFIDDSVKYFSPLQYIYAKSSVYIFESLHFSLFNKVISHFFQILNDGSLEYMMIFQKFLGFTSSIIFFILIKRNSKLNNIWISIFTLIFSLNPFMLYIEQLVMPEVYFIFFSLTMLLLTDIFIKTDNKILHYTLAATFGIISFLFSITKESTFYLLALAFMASIVYLLVDLTRKNFQIKNLICLVIVFVSYHLCSLPFKLYNLEKHGSFTMSTKSTKGVVLYGLSEEMMKKSINYKHGFISKLILDRKRLFIEKYREKGLEVSERNDFLAYTGAISDINVYGREAKLRNPNTGKAVSSKEWARLCSQHVIDTVLHNPILFLKRVFQVSFKNLFLSNNYCLHYHRKSRRPNLNYEVMQFTVLPFSLKNKRDPKLKNTKIIQGAQQIDQALKQRDYFLLMANRNTDYAFLVKDQGISLFLQKSFEKMPFIRWLLPLFLIVSFINILNYKTFMTNYFKLIVFISASYFMLLPLMVAVCEARYRLQFIHLLVLFIALNWQQVLDKFKSKS